MFVTPQKAIQYSVNNNGPGPHKSFKSINQSINQREFGALNSSPLSGLFTSVSVGSSSPFYRFTSATGRIGVYTALKYDKKPIRYLILNF